MCSVHLIPLPLSASSSLSLMCDGSATFQTPFVSLGQSCEGLSSLLFPQLMGMSKANEILLTGATIDAKQYACFTLLLSLFGWVFAVSDLYPLLYLDTRRAEQRNLVSSVFPVEGFHEAVHKRALAVAKLPVNTLKANKGLTLALLLLL
jgi:enoyl-CoA hydratase/carnithine racemase